MSTVILMTPQQAAEIRGASAVSSAFALAPVELSGGTVAHPDIRFFLSTAVLDDPAHQAHRDHLLAFPQVDFSEIAELLLPPPERA